MESGRSSGSKPTAWQSDAPRRLAVAHMMRPRSIAIIGVSARSGSAGYNAAANVMKSGYPAELHLVGRGGGTIEGHACLTSVEQLPEGIDLAILALPASGMREAIEACIERRVRGAVIFAAGFSETGDAGQAEQQTISTMAKAGGLALLGPNCLGFNNLVDGLPVGFFASMGAAQRRYQGSEGIALLGQSGLLIAHIRAALEARRLATSYFITTGNEAGLDLADFVSYFAEDPQTRQIVLFAEQVRRPQVFLDAAAQALAVGKRIVMLHTGKSERAKATARSHTGALAGDYAAMRTAVERTGIVLVDTLEEIVDVAELLIRFPAPPTKGVGIVSFSGAFCGQAHDYCGALGLDIPRLSASVAETLRPQLPEFVQPSNPLDLTTQPAWQPELLGIGVKALIDDPAIGSVVIATPVGTAAQASHYLDGLLPRLEGNTKPIMFGAMTDGRTVPSDFLECTDAARLPFISSPERALRAVAKLTAYGKRISTTRYVMAPHKPFASLPELGNGTIPEWRGKELLSAIGVTVPQGGLARSLEEARAIASRIGYPVALKAQAASLAHKTEFGGVILGVEDAQGVARAWDLLHANVRSARSDLALDGILVEVMAPKGLELMVGARRDPEWGPILLIGLGGMWVEAIGDVRLMPPDLAAESIVQEFYSLKCARLLQGFRGSPPLDIEAAAAVVQHLGRFVLTHPEVLEIDINPLVLYSKGAVALDALIVAR